MPLRPWAKSYKVVAKFACPDCGEEHELEDDYIEVDPSGCDCCSDELFVNVKCPQSKRVIEVKL